MSPDVDPQTLERIKPLGWDMNPSERRARFPIFLLSMAGLALTVTLADRFDALGPLQRDREIFVITCLSGVVVLSAIGNERRWSRKPWLVVLFGLIAGPLSFAAALWSLLEMATNQSWLLRETLRAFVALLCIGPAMDEVLASLQYVRRKANRGFSPLAAFFGLPPRPRRRGEVRTI